MAVGQPDYLLLIHRIRGQARSHSFGLWRVEILRQAQMQVGAGLPAMAVGQSDYLLLIHRIREQARSHSLIAFQIERGEPAQSAITTIDTRRFSVRPATVVFGATGSLLPKPRSWMFSSFMPTPVNTLPTLLARRRDSCWL